MVGKYPRLKWILLWIFLHKQRMGDSKRAISQHARRNNQYKSCAENSVAYIQSLPFEHYSLAHRKAIVPALLLQSQKGLMHKSAPFFQESLQQFVKKLC